MTNNATAKGAPMTFDFINSSDFCVQVEQLPGRAAADSSMNVWSGIAKTRGLIVFLPGASKHRSRSIKGT
jgi:hypothetical protein